MERDAKLIYPELSPLNVPSSCPTLKTLHDQESSADTFFYALSISKCIANVLKGSLYIINHMFYSLSGSELLCVDVYKPADISWNKSSVW